MFRYIKISPAVFNDSDVIFRNLSLDDSVSNMFSNDPTCDSFSVPEKRVQSSSHSLSNEDCNFNFQTDSHNFSAEMLVR